MRNNYKSNILSISFNDVISAYDFKLHFFENKKQQKKKNGREDEKKKKRERERRIRNNLSDGDRRRRRRQHQQQTNKQDDRQSKWKEHLHQHLRERERERERKDFVNPFQDRRRNFFLFLSGCSMRPLLVLLNGREKENEANDQTLFFLSFFLSLLLLREQKELRAPRVP